MASLFSIIERIALGWILLLALAGHVSFAETRPATESFHERWQAQRNAAQSAGNSRAVDYLADRPLPRRADQHFFCLPEAMSAFDIELKPAAQDASGKELWKSIRTLGREESLQLIASARAAATRGEGELAYRQLWEAHRADPANLPLATMLGVPEMLAEPKQTVASRAIKELGWPARSYHEFESANFRLATKVPAEVAVLLIKSLETDLAIWRQAFFLAWSNSAAMADAINKAQTPLVANSPKMRVVLFADRESYVTSLSPLAPGVERSTGFYAPSLQTTYLFHGEDADMATRHHELTHQFFQEVSRFRNSRQPGRTDGFWIVEGIATYAESMRVLPTYATLGGWESPRLQSARYRWLQQNQRRELSEMLPLAQSQLQQLPDLAQWYTDAAAFVHLILDSDDAKQRDELFDYLESVYRRGGDARKKFQNVTASNLIASLSVDDQKLAMLTDGRSVTDLCLGGTNITEAGLSQLPPLPDLKWLDLASLAFGDQTLAKLLSSSPGLRRLNLERTQITDASATAIESLTRLHELDVSSTLAGDRLGNAVAHCPDLRILWATATPMTDSVVPTIESLPKLEQVDLQLSRVTPAAIEKLKVARPNLVVNPLQLQ